VGVAVNDGHRIEFGKDRLNFVGVIGPEVPIAIIICKEASGRRSRSAFFCRPLRDRFAATGAVRPDFEARLDAVIESGTVCIRSSGVMPGRSKNPFPGRSSRSRNARPYGRRNIEGAEHGPPMFTMSRTSRARQPSFLVSFEVLQNLSAEIEFSRRPS